MEGEKVHQDGPWGLFYWRLEINVAHLLAHNAESVIVPGNCSVLSLKKSDLLLGDVAHIARTAAA